MKDYFLKLKSNLLTYKHSIVKKVTATICFTMLLTASAGVALSENKTSSLDTIYHIYVDDIRVGSLKDLHTYEHLVDEKMSVYKGQYDHMDLVVGQDVKIIPELVFVARANDERTLAKLDELITITAKSTALMVEDSSLLHIPEHIDAEQLLEQYTLQYVSEEDYEAYQAKKASGNEESTQLPAVGEKEIRRIDLSKPIEIKESFARPEEVLTAEEALQKLKLGVAKLELYEVKAGDVLGSIAKEHGLTTKELIALNEGVDEKTVLQIGQQLQVEKHEPLVTVVLNKVQTVEEEIPFQTEIKEDDTLWKGDTKTVQEGKPGKRVVSYELVYENGKEVAREIVQEEVVDEAVNRVIVKGTKESPSRGTGKLSWPAVGGYISSYQGNRWGRFHKGIDIARPSNYNILAADNGKVIYAGYDGGYGNVVKIDHNNGIVTLYAHLRSIDVRVGQIVSSGQKIGVMGRTGNSTGIHLHFEIYRNGKLENPMDYLKR